MTDQERVEEFVKKHEPPFKMVGRDDEGNITFCVPIPGQEHHDLDDVDGLEDAWVKYIREVLPDVKIKKKYRTASIAGELTSVPKRRILITNTHP